MTERHGAPHSAQEWDERYSGERVWSGHPNAALVAEVQDLPPGRALDVGCGEGADAVWLAQHGWHVTALDVSARAVELTLAATQRAGRSAEGVAAGLLDAALPTGSFDLVTAMFPVLERTPERIAEHLLLDLVAPGGTLLIAHHADIDYEHARAHGCDPDAYVAPADVRALAEEVGGWRVVTDEDRTRDAVHGAGSAHHRDTIVRLQRA